MTCVAAIRTRLDKAPAVQSVDPLAEAIGKLIDLPAEIAAAWQKASVVIVVELLIAFALVGFELLGREGRKEEKAEAHARAAEPKSRNVTSIEKARPLGEVAKFMVACLRPAEQGQLVLAELFEPYTAWCSREGLRTLSAARFEEQVVVLCEKAGFELSRAKGKVRCRGLQLAA